eukprot:4965401-Amphidinium_carterae.1
MSVFPSLSNGFLEHELVSHSTIESQPAIVLGHGVLAMLLEASTFRADSGGTSIHSFKPAVGKTSLEERCNTEWSPDVCQGNGRETAGKTQELKDRLRQR